MDPAKWRPPPSMEPDMTGTNDAQTLRRRLDAGTLTWRGPAVMLFARSAWAVVATSACRGHLCIAVVADAMA